MNKLDTILYKYLVEENNMDINEFNLLTEDFKMDTIKELASSVLANINSKINSLDVLPIDKTRGEIKNFADLSTVQDVIIKLKNMSQEDFEKVNPLLPKYLNEIITSIYNLNNFSSEFKDAYRSKKTLLILRYQSIILSIISALSYLVSVSIDFKSFEKPTLKKTISIEEISPIKCLIDFNKSVEDGTFSDAIKDTTLLREFYTEYTVDELSTIYEAVDLVSLLNNGIAAFSDKFVNNKKRNVLLLKTVGIINIIMSIRDTFYMLYNSKYKISDALQNLKSFLHVDSFPKLSAFSRFVTFNNKNIIDAETSSKRTEQQIDIENKDVITKAKNTPSIFDSTSAFVPTEIKDDTPEQQKDSSEDAFSNFAF